MVKGEFIVATFCVCAAATIASTSFPGTLGSERQIKTLTYNNNGFGAYSFEFESADGTYRREEGGLASDTESMVVRGEYKYISPEGKIIAVKYIADANGFQPLTNDDTRFNDRNII